MDLPSLSFRPGHVVEADIFHRYGVLVCHDPSSYLPEFFLVLSFGRYQFWLIELSVATILQSVVGGVSSAFYLHALGDRVFCFSILFPTVGFHVYSLKSFECP